ncbi:hypothetical protein KIPB_004969, partial [Kipferlia bialata]
ARLSSTTSARPTRGRRGKGRPASVIDTTSFVPSLPRDTQAQAPTPSVTATPSSVCAAPEATTATAEASPHVVTPAASFFNPMTDLGKVFDQKRREAEREAEREAVPPASAGAASERPEEPERERETGTLPEVPTERPDRRALPMPLPGKNQFRLSRTLPAASVSRGKDISESSPGALNAHALLAQQFSRGTPQLRHVPSKEASPEDAVPPGDLPAKQDKRTREFCGLLKESEVKAYMYVRRMGWPRSMMELDPEAPLTQAQVDIIREAE